MRRMLLWMMILALMLSPACLAESVILIGSDASGSEQELVVGERIKEDDNYYLRLNGANWPTDEELIKAYSYIYLESTENGAALCSYSYPVGTHAPMIINLEFTNVSTEETEALDRIQCRVVFDDEYAFDTIILQTNPDQTGSDGNIGHPSTQGVKVEPLIKVVISALTSFPLAVRESDAPLTAYFTIDENLVYTVNLREVIQ